MDYIISCCSPVDLPFNRLKERGAYIKNFHFMLANKEMEDDGGESISFKDFYQAMRDGASTKTSQVNSAEFVDYFTDLINKENKDIIHVTLSSGISGTFNSARLAAEEVKEKFPERKIYIVDSLGASGGYGFLVEWLLDKRDEGMDIDTLYNFAEENKLKVNHWFYSTDLTFFVKGGRITKTEGFVGKILKICPVMNVSNEGKLIPRIKTMGKKSALQKTVEIMRDLADDGTNYAGRCIITHADCFDDANQLKCALEQNFPNLAGKILISDIGTTIGCHTGPGTVALFFSGKKREN